MTIPQPKTVVIHAHGMVAAFSSNVMVELLSKKLDFKRVKAIQFIPNGRIRVTCTSVEYRNSILAKRALWIDDHHQLQVTESDSPVTTVYVHYLPPEADDCSIRLALAPFGTVVGEISYQRFSGFKQIATGTRIVRMSLEHHIPFQCNIQGYPCRVWYVGQPLKCTICRGAHKAAECPDRGRCRLCRMPGHIAKDCKNAWGTAPQASRALTGPPPPPPTTTSAPSNPPASVPPVSGPSSPPPHVSVVVPSASSATSTVSSVVLPAPSADPSLANSPPPLMSLHISPSQTSGSADADLGASQVSLFSNSQESIGSFSDEVATPSPAPSPSPDISSFTSSSDDSQSILKNVAIVSSDPLGVGQIFPDNSSVNDVVGPKEAIASPNVSNGVVGPKETIAPPNLSSGVVGPKEAIASDNVTHKSNDVSAMEICGSKSLKRPAASQAGAASDSDSSTSGPAFKVPHAPKPRRSPSQSPVRGRSRSPIVPGSPGAHKGIPQVSPDRPSRRT